MTRRISDEEARTLAKAISLAAQQVSAIDKRLCPLSPLACALDQVMELIERCAEQHVGPTVMRVGRECVGPGTVPCGFEVCTRWPH